jgi:hypothetical protein
MISFKEFIENEETPEELEEGFLKFASVGVLGAKHRNLKMTALQRLKGAFESAGKVSGQKDVSAKLDLLAVAYQEQILALQNFAEMSGANFSVSAVAALLSQRDSRPRRRRR